MFGINTTLEFQKNNKTKIKNHLEDFQGKSISEVSIQCVSMKYNQNNKEQTLFHREKMSKSIKTRKHFNMTFEKHRESWAVEQYIISVEIQEGAVGMKASR